MKLKVGIGVLISGFFIYLAFRDVNFQEMLAALRSANYLWLLPAFFAMLISHWIRASRWRSFLSPIKEVGVHPLFSSLMIGYAANNVFPLRLGEFLRAFALGKSQSVSKSSAFATVIVERLIDLLSLLVLLAGTILVYPLPPDIRKAGYVIFFITLSAIVFMVFLMEKTDGTIRLLNKLLPSKIFHAIEKTVKSFLQGFVVFKKSEHYFKITVTSILIWFFYALVVYATFLAFSLHRNYEINFLSSFVVLVTVSIGIMIPSSPGFVGTYHWFCMKSLSFYGVPHSEALSFAVISHALNTLPFTVIGLIYFWRENLHFSDAIVEKDLVEHEIEEEKIESPESSESLSE
ncbi:flippase-like domain-containing protein [candidate division KSB1 bacterium]|nr:flippase-like domain-containing protein [candidate division KSB1 bacterium]